MEFNEKHPGKYYRRVGKNAAYNMYVSRTFSVYISSRGSSSRDKSEIVSDDPDGGSCHLLFVNIRDFLKLLPSVLLVEVSIILCGCFLR